MPMFTPNKALGNLPKTPVILAALLQGVDQQRARTSTDGPDGWSVLEVLGHLNEYEQVFFDRVRQAVESDLPRYVGYDQAALAKANHYNDQPLNEVFASYVNRRRAFLAYVKALTPEQWQRRGIHPESGEVSVVELVTNTTLHDVNHIEQIVKALGGTPPLAEL